MSDETSLTVEAAAAIAPELPDILPPVRVRRGIRGFVWRHPTLSIGLVLLGLMILVALLAPWLGSVDPTALAPAKRTREPNAEFWFGSDAYGGARHLLARAVRGANLPRFSVAVLASLLGLVLGLVSGYLRSLDDILMRVMDGVMSVPPILLAISLMALTRASVENVIVAITIAEFPRVARLVGGVVLSLREQPFVDAAITAGTSTPRIIWAHILPNTVAPLSVQATYICGSAMIVKSILSFIGAGTPPIIPSWGNIMADGRTLWQVKPYIILFPAIFLSVTVLAVNLLGDGLRDALDPRMAKRL